MMFGVLTKEMMEAAAEKARERFFPVLWEVAPELRPLLRAYPGSLPYLVRGRECEVTLFMGVSGPPWVLIDDGGGAIELCMAMRFLSEAVALETMDDRQASIHTGGPPPFEGPWPIDEAWPIEEPEGPWPFEETEETDENTATNAQPEDGPTETTHHQPTLLEEAPIETEDQ